MLLEEVGSFLALCACGEGCRREPRCRDDLRGGRGHSSIVRELRASIPVRVVAVNHDTRVVTIERTYSRHIGDHADVLARKALLDLAATPSSYVVPIAAGR